MVNAYNAHLLDALFDTPTTRIALPGIAGIFSGWSAEVNEDLLQRRTIQVLTNGFDAKRKEIYEQILKDWKNQDLTQYSVERAIGDAVFYHEHCGLIAGLEYAALAIERVEDPGLNHLPGV